MKDTDIGRLEKLQCPTFLDGKNFEKAKSGLLRVWTGKVSASMSGLEYYSKEVEWILEAIRSHGDNV